MKQIHFDMDLQTDGLVLGNNIYRRHDCLLIEENSYAFYIFSPTDFSCATTSFYIP